MESGVRVLTPEEQAEQQWSQKRMHKRILEEELNALGVSKFLQDTLDAHNAADPDKWVKRNAFDYLDAPTLTIELYRNGVFGITRSLPRGDFREEKVVFKFSIPKENQPRTVTITGTHQTFSGEIPNMNDVSDGVKEEQRRFKKAIEAALFNPQITKDCNPHSDDDRYPLNWSSPAIPHWRI